jgi:RNA polymerase sigma-70 factor (ECF subfamily)
LYHATQPLLALQRIGALKTSGTDDLSRDNSVELIMGAPETTAGNLLERTANPAAIPAHVSADIRLIERFREGERDAFAEIYRVHHPAVFRFAFYMTADRDAAAEVTQETFVWLIDHAGRFDPARGDLGAFLGGVARQMIRKRNRSLLRWLPFERARRVENRSPDSAPGSGIERAIDAAALRAAVARLPLRYRETVVLCDLESQSYEEAARALGCAVGTIRSRLHRGRELLARKFLQGKEIGQ